MKNMIPKNYVVTALFYLKNQLEIKEHFIKIQEYSLFCTKLYEIFANNNLYVLISEEDLDSKYFYKDENSQEIKLCEPSCRSLENAKNRYMGYIPFKFLDIMYGSEALKAVYEIIINVKKEEVARLYSEITLLENNYENNFKLARKK